MGKAKAAKAAVDLDTLVRQALTVAAAAGGPVRPTGKPKDGEPVALFPTAAGAAKSVLEECEREGLLKPAPGRPSLFVLSRAGFDRVADGLDPATLVSVVRRLAPDVPAAERVAFLNEILRRSPGAVAELVGEVEAAAAAEKADADMRVAAAAEQRRQEAATAEAMERWKRAMSDRQAARVAALRRELAAVGEAADPPAEVARPKPHPEPTQGLPPVQPPRTDAEADYRRRAAGRLVSVWLQQSRQNKPDGRQALENALGGLSGVSAIGSENESVAFSSPAHECDTPVRDGDAVRVVRPGWRLDEEGGTFILSRAQVEPTRA